MEDRRCFSILTAFVASFSLGIPHSSPHARVNRLNAVAFQPLEDISCVSWNRQVQHILASASPSGRASVWDLRKNDLIIKVSDHSNRVSPRRHATACRLQRLVSAEAPPSSVCVCWFLDALLWNGVEPGSSHSAGLGLGGRPDAGHPDVGLAFRDLASEDSRESLKVQFTGNKSQEIHSV